MQECYVKKIDKNGKVTTVFAEKVKLPYTLNTFLNDMVVLSFIVGIPTILVISIINIVKYSSVF